MLKHKKNHKRQAVKKKKKKVSNMVLSVNISRERIVKLYAFFKIRPKDMKAYVV